MVLTCDVYAAVQNNVSSHTTSTYTCSVANIVMATPAVLLNSSVIISILKSNERTEPYNMLMLNLAITDVLAGLFVMPSYFVQFFYVASNSTFCEPFNLLVTLGYLLGLVSLLSITTTALERYIKVFHPFVHSIRKTSYTLAIIIFGTWSLPIGSACLIFFTKSHTYSSTSTVLYLSFTSPVIFFCYTKILLRVRSIRRQIEAEAERFGHHRINEKDKNLLFVGGLIIISYFVCFFPIFIRSMMVLLKYKERAFDHVLCWELTLYAANSLVNPIISCLFNPAIRSKVIKIWTCAGRHVRSS